MKYYLLIFSCFISTFLLSQETKLGCILIDFENVFEQDLFEGAIISNQFEQEFGLTFQLESGGFPVLAQVGSPITAFQSAWGNDVPAPEDEAFIGQFFLTDDGSLAGLDADPVILNFSTPIDSFAGCILDMDFGEVFKLETFDQFGNLILSDSIVAGEPGTGDGLATCWGFNLDGCVGTVYQVKFSGYRTTSGGFGLGLDNFSFCFSGINVDVRTVQPTCLALDGSLEIFSTSDEVYQYSLDNVTFSESGVFTGLPPDVHRVFVIDENGCETFVDVPILAAEDPLFVEVDTVSTSCNLDNGRASFEVTPDLNAMFSIDGQNYTTDHFFTDLAPGDYTIQAVDDNGCTGELNFTIDPSTEVEIQNVVTIPESCEANDGTISFEGIMGNSPYTYSIDGTTFQETNSFENLASGPYTLSIMDADGCLDSTNATINPYPFIEIISDSSTDPECLASDGVIRINATGGFGSLSYAINGGSFSAEPVFTNLDPGTYMYTVRDDNDCEVIDSIALAIPLCPIYIPNIISGNGDGANDEFIIYVDPDYNVDILEYWIFDRWGELIFHSENFNIHEFNTNPDNTKPMWWDGKFKKKNAVEGVYAYLINVRHENGEIGKLAGTVTLVR